MKKALVLLLAVSLDGVASEVGAHYPQLADPVQNTLAVAIAETGASRSWATQTSYELASTIEMKEFAMRVEGFDVNVNQELGELIEQKLELLLADK